MAGEASVFQTGGGGFNYENYVQASFLSPLARFWKACLFIVAFAMLFTDF